MLFVTKKSYFTYNRVIDLIAEKLLEWESSIISYVIDEKLNIYVLPYDTDLYKNIEPSVYITNKICFNDIMYLLNDMMLNKYHINLKEHVRYLDEDYEIQLADRESHEYLDIEFKNRLVGNIEETIGFNV